jgi:subtilisin-like proprotein convertase family protein/photosystem II stability/assembly factor-like uncharacterized protein
MNFPTLFSAMRKKYLIAAAQAAYKKHTPRLRVENLESREVPATLPAPVLDETTIRTISNEANNGNTDRGFAPVIAVNPSNPDLIFAAFVKSGPFTNVTPSDADDTRISISFSRNGGNSYQTASGSVNLIEDIGIDPKATTRGDNPIRYTNVSNPAVAFDNFNRAYLTYIERNGDSTSGRLILRRFDMASGTPVEIGNAKVLYSWVDSDKAYNPTIAIDTNLDTFVDPTVQNASGTQTDALAAAQTNPNQVRVFVAWNTDNIDPTNRPRSEGFTPSVIKMMASADGGLSFGATAIVNSDLNSNGGNWGAEYTQPKIVFTQGRAGVAGSGGKMIVMFTNSNTDISTAPQSLIADTTSFTAATVPHTVEVSNNTGMGLSDASDPGNSLPHVPGVTEFNLQVPAGTDLTEIDNISLTLSLLHDNLAQVRIELVAPDGTRVTLLRNGVDTAGNAIGNPQIGIAGTTLGVVNYSSTIPYQGANVGTTFQDNASRNIDDDSAVGSAYTGTYSPSGSLLQAFGGLTAAQIAGTWKVVVTDMRNSGTVTTERRIRSATLRLTQNLSDGLGSDVVTGAIPVKGAASGTAYPTASTALPAGVGIGPSISVAVDNSLGAFSQYQGRIYVAYQVGGSIGVRFSDDGGTRWSVETVVGTGYKPTISVDQTTGTVVVAYYSTQFDASGTRSAMMISTSINGPIFNPAVPNTNNLEFSTPTYVNATEKYYDQVSSTLKDFEPVTTNGVNAGPEGFGNNVGLAVVDGRVNLLYTGNLNSAGRQIWTQNLNIAAGPRIVSGQQGVIATESSAQIRTQNGQNIATTGFVSFNDEFDSNGARVFNGFVIEFDRPIDPSTLTAADIQVLFRSPTANPVSGGTPITVSNIQRLDFLRDPLDNSDYGSKRFLIHIPNQSAVGTYSYAVRSDISDRVRSKTFNYVNGTSVDFSNTTPVTIIDATGPLTNPVSSTIIASGFTPNQLVGDVKVTLNITHTNVRDLDIRLRSPSGQIISLVPSNIQANDPTKYPNYEFTTFDDSSEFTLSDDFAPFTGSYRPAERLSTFFASEINGAWTLIITDTNQGDLGTLDDWSIELTPATLQSTTSNGNKMDQDGDGKENEAAVGGVEGDTFAVPNPINGVPFQLPYTTGSLPIIIAGPRIVSTRVQGNPQTSNNLVLNGSVKSIDIQFDRTISTASFTAADVLGFTGPLGNISLSGVKVVPITALNGTATTSATANSKFYRITFSEQKLSGGYTLQLGSNIQDTLGNSIDTNLNAGVGNLMGSATGSDVTPIIYGGTALNVAIPGKSTTTVNLSVTDAYLLQKATANITVNQAKTRDLEIRLVAPDGTSVLLFNNAPVTGNDSAGIINATFDDAASTPIQLGGGGFANGKYNPIQPLAQLLNRSVNGTWKLVIKNNGTVAGTVTKFGLTFDKPLVGTGLGEEVADQSSLSFRIHQTDGSTDTAKNNWTPVGPNGVVNAFGQNNNTVGRISAIAVDPTDPSGNIVYAAGASGGVWRTTNFLTKDADGPTWVPLTDFGPNNAINVGSIALYNTTNDPSKTMIIVGTGSSSLNTISQREQDDLTFNGVGVLTSDDAGKTWQVLDSNTNYSAGSYLSYSDSLRDHAFVGTVVNKIVVETKVDSTSTRPIIYAAIGRGSAAAGTEGLYRSRDGGRTWAKIFTGEATDFTLAAGSVASNAAERPTIGYLAIQGQGVFRTVNLTSSIPNFTMMNGGVGRPTVWNTTANPDVPVTVDAPIDTPNGANGKITLAVPSFVNADPLANNYYQSWLYAAVTRTDGSLDGLYMTKDAGANWTRVKITQGGGFDDTLPDVEEIPDTNRSFLARGGNHSLALAVDPTNPNIVYLGSDSLVRVDTTFVNDAYNLSMYNYSNNDGGQVRGTNTGSVSAVNSATLGGGLLADNPNIPRFNTNESQTPTTAAAYAARLRANEDYKWNFLNTVRDPYNPFFTDTTLYTSNVTKFNNTGNDARWVNTGVEARGDFSFVSNIITMIDPLTGQARLLYGSDEGIDSYVFNSNASINSVNSFGSNLQVNGTRNGDIQVARLYSGDVQPSLLASSISGALYYAASHRAADVVVSDGGIMSNGNTLWQNIGRDEPANYVTTDQTGTGAVYILRRINDASVPTDFFQVSLAGNAPISRTSGLFQNDADALGDGQWDNSVKRFAVNPIDPLGIIMGSNEGRLFGTTDQGLNWFVIAEPGVLDGTMLSGLAFGAPLPSASSLNEYIYAGTEGGKLFVTTTGGGAWTDISTGLDGSAVQKIIPNPTRGSNSAYVVTEKGVFFTTDWTQPGFTWQNITGTLLTTKSNSFGSSSYSTELMTSLSTMAVDWRPLTAPNLGLPVLYVGGDGGVFRSTDGGVSWARFPATGTSGSGGLPVVKVTDLDLSLGNINPTTGITNSNGSPDVLVATTLGRGAWAIKLAKPEGVSGPKVTASTPSTPLDGSTPFDTITLEFSGYIDPTTFTADDVIIKRPDGTTVLAADITVTDVTSPPVGEPNLHNKWVITFPGQLAEGTYIITVGPNITDGGGTPMNQDGDKINGEATADQFKLSVVIGKNDIADYVKDVYQELLGRGPTSDEYLAKSKAIIAARLSSLGGVVTTLLRTDEARTEMINRLFTISGAFTNEIGNLIPGYTLTPTELTSYLTGLKKGTMSPESILKGILNKPEYFTHAGGTNADFVTHVYQDLLGRAPSPTDLTKGTSQVGTAKGKTTFINTLVNGTEYRNRVVTMAYRKYLNDDTRVVTTAELSAGRTLIAQALAANNLQGSERVVRKILASQEYFDKQVQAEGSLPDNGLHTNRAWVASIFTNYIHRAATGTEIDTNTTTILGKMKASQTTFINSLTASAEFKEKDSTAQANLYYQQILGRAPLEAELALWIKNIKAGQRHDQQIARILGSTEFHETRAPQVVGGGASVSKETFIRAMYQVLLGRAPTEGASNAELELAKKNTGTRTAIALSLLRKATTTLTPLVPSTFAIDLIQDYYSDILGITLSDTDPLIASNMTILKNSTFLWSTVKRNILLSRDFYEVKN